MRDVDNKSTVHTVGMIVHHSIAARGGLQDIAVLEGLVWVSHKAMCKLSQSCFIENDDQVEEAMGNDVLSDLEKSTGYKLMRM